jgi:hypothetical protein
VIAASKHKRNVKSSPTSWRKDDDEFRRISTRSVADPTAQGLDEALPRLAPGQEMASRFSRIEQPRVVFQMDFQRRHPLRH